MTAAIIPFKPRHQPVIESREALLVALSMIRSGGHSEQVIDLLISQAADILYDYVETLEGR